MVGLIVLAIFVVLSILAVFYGVDSTDGSTDPRRPVSPVGLR